MSLALIYMAHFFFFFFSSRRRHTRLQGDWSSDVCSSDLDHDDRRDLETREHVRRGQSRIHVARVRRHCGARRGGARPTHGVEQLPHRALELVPRSRVEAPAHGRRAHGVQAYLKLWPIARPKEISPLSMRMLNPHSGFEQTQAL